MECRNEAGTKRLLNLDIDIADSGTSTHGRLKLAMLQKNIGKRQKRKRRKTSKADERWKTHGHLPRSSVIQKYIANSKKCKTTWKPEDLQAKAGGYCALPCDLKKINEIHSVQGAIELGFMVIECNDV